MWTALPVIGIFIPFTSKFIQYMSLVAPLLEAALLQGVRRRAWAWILASMAGVVLTQFFFWLMYQAGGSGMIQRLLEGTLGNTSPKAALALATSGVFRGIWIVSEAISAAVLAWKMPPITSPNADPKGYTVS
jgi:hypothetical protein